MKFLLELVLCCRSSSSSSQQRASLPKEERRLLVGHVSPRRRANRVIRGVKRGRNNGRSSVVGEWQPSLSSISEDNVVFYEDKGRRRVDEMVVTAAAADGLASSIRNNLKRNKVLSTTENRRSRSLGDNNG